MSDLLEGNFEDLEVKVSSVLNRQVVEYGKKFMFDGREDTCWNSDQGTPQWVRIEFDNPEELAELKLMFQGGFAGKTCWLEVSEDGQEFVKHQDFFPDDINKLQSFPITPKIKAKAIKVVFEDSTDFFGRITVYQMKLISV